MKSVKAKKIASDIVRNVSDILANEANDDIMKTITITGSEVSSDGSYAKVYFTSFSSLDTKTLEKEMKEAAGFIRTKLASVMELRHTPELHFVYDSSVEYGNRIESIIKEINNKDN